MTRNRISLTLGLALALSIAGVPREHTAAPQKPGTPEALLGSALHQEEAEGNLEAAIAIYKKLISEQGVDRALAAKAQLHIGICYERLGQAEARRAYEQVLSSYTDQHEVVEQARVRLAALAGSNHSRSTIARRVWEDFPLDNTGTFLGSVSPDGRHVAFVDWSPDGRQVLVLGTFGEGRIALLSVADGTLRILKVLDRRFPQRMSFSPDGRHIAYDLPSQPGSRTRDIFLLAADGSGEIPLVRHPANDSLLGWTPDGRAALFTSDRTGREGVWAITVAEGKPQAPPELLKPDLGPIHPLGFARNGSFFYGVRTGVRDVYTAELDLASGRVLSPPAPVAERFVGANMAPEWSADGSYLAWVSNRGQHPNRLNADTLCIRSNATGEIREISPKLDFMYRLRWYPGGRYLLVQAVGTEVGLFRMDSLSGEHTTVRLRLDKESLKQPALSPDGKTVYFVHGDPDSKNEVIRARDLATGQEQIVCRPPSWPYGLAISPDGRQLALYEGWERNSSLSVAPIATDQLRTLFSSSQGIKTIAWTPDGRHLLFSLTQPANGTGSTATTDLWLIPAEGGQPRKLDLTMDSLADLRVQPDGRHIAFVAGSHKGEVWVMENFLPGTK